MSSENILILGDILLDRYLVNSIYLHRIGCSGNIINVLEELKSKYLLVTSFPKPDLINLIFDECAYKSGSLITFPAEGKTNVVEYLVDDGVTKQIKDKPEPVRNINDLEMAEIIKNSCSKKILVSDYGLGGIGPISKESLREKFKDPAVISFVDARKSNYLDYFGASWFFPTEDEFRAFLGQCPTKESLKEFSEILSAYGVILKRGDRGLIKYTNGEESDFSIPNNYLAVDVFGAGDMLMAIIASTTKTKNLDVNTIRKAMLLLAEKLTVNGAGSLGFRDR